MGCVLFHISACKDENKNSNVNNLFEILEGELKNTKILEDIRTTREDSLYEMLPIFTSLCKGGKFDDKDCWINFIDSTFAQENNLLLDEILFLGFQKYLRNEKVGLVSIKNKVLVYQEKRRKKYNEQERNNEKELASIIKNNDNKWMNKDTISILLQVKKVRGSRLIFYSDYPYSLDYSYADDTLQLKGVIVEKLYETGSKDLFDLIFKIKVLELDNGLINSLDSENIKVGSNFNLHLESYGRLIE